MISVYLLFFVFFDIHFYIFFFFNDTATTEIYTLSLHDALPIFDQQHAAAIGHRGEQGIEVERPGAVAHFQGHPREDRKSTRLNSSHVKISYAVFCLKKKKIKHT